MMPGESGLDCAAALRRESHVPILMLTAMGEVDDRIKGLEAGADDYLAKPCEPRELLLRIRTVLRRAAPDPEAEGGEIRLGDFRFDLARELLLDSGGVVRLTSTETGLLKALGSKPGRILSREELTQLCAVDGGERTIDRKSVV